MIKKINFTLTIIAMTLAIFLICTRNNIAMSKGNAMLEVYSRYDFDVMQVNIKSNGIINKKNSNFIDESEIINHILKKLDINSPSNIETVECDDTKIYKVIKDSESAKVIIELKSKNTEETEIELNFMLYENENALLYLQNKVKEVYESMHSKANTHITIIGTYDKKITVEETRKNAKRILSCIKSNIIEEYETERLYSAYGYTELIDNYKVVDGKKVNVHLAFRYNEYEDKTYLYLASPIISEDY